MALQHPPDFAPGASWSYSNTNYILAGMIIERVTGRPWPVEVRRRIVRPLGLSDTLEPGDDPDLHGPHAHAYQQFSDDGPFIDATRLNHTVAGAAGSLVTTTEDLSTFLRALQQGRLLRPAEMAEMHRTVPATELEPVMPGLRYGLGLMQFPGSCGEPYWSHFGDTMGFSTRDAVSADGNRTVVVSLTASLSGEATLGILAEDLALLDDVMCDGQD
jgi:D-alanyl-D-alanine carboxypeptidase